MGQNCCILFNCCSQSLFRSNLAARYAACCFNGMIIQIQHVPYSHLIAWHRMYCTVIVIQLEIYVHIICSNTNRACTANQINRKAISMQSSKAIKILLIAIQWKSDKFSAGHFQFNLHIMFLAILFWKTVLHN